MLRPLLIMLAALTPLNISAQFLPFDSIRFQSEYEKEILSSVSAGKRPPEFDLLIAAGARQSRREIERFKTIFYSRIDSLHKIVYKKDVNEQTRYVLSKMRDLYLRKLSLHVQFVDIFLSGRYDNTGGTALLALVCDTLHIPYQITTTGELLHLTALADRETIYASTSDDFTPSRFTPEFKDAFVEMLLMEKRISAKEKNGQSNDDLFNRYWLNADGSLTLPAAASLQYREEGLRLILDQTNFEYAANQLAKAWLIDRDPRDRFLGGYALRELAEKMPGESEQRGRILGLLFSAGIGIVTDKDLYSALETAFEQTTSMNKEVALTGFYNSLASQVKDPVVSKQLSFIFNYEFGLMSFNGGNYSGALPYAEKALTIQPEDDGALNLLANCAISSMKGYPKSAGLQKMQDYSSRFPGLVSNKHFVSTLGTYYLQAIFDAFTKNDPAGGEKLADSFYALYKKNPEHLISQESIGQAFDAGVAFFQKSNQLAKAKALLNRGLEMAPSSSKLKQRSVQLSK